MTTVESTRRPLIISLRRRRNNPARTAWKLARIDAELKSILLLIEDTEFHITRTNRLVTILPPRFPEQRAVHKNKRGGVVASFVEAPNTANG